VGEIGLDYFIETLDRERQQALFDAQLQLAADFDLPALIHVRRSHAAVIATLKRFKLKRAGIIHAFAGSREEAREYIKLGFKLGLGGAPTWPQALRMHRVLAELPLDSIVLETDSPDMAPAMFPGTQYPAHLPAICAALAELMNISPEQLAAPAPPTAAKYSVGNTPSAGAAARCDLLLLALKTRSKIAASFHSAAPTVGLHALWLRRGSGSCADGGEKRRSAKYAKSTISDAFNCSVTLSSPIHSMTSATSSAVHTVTEALKRSNPSESRDLKRLICFGQRNSSVFWQCAQVNGSLIAMALSCHGLSNCVVWQ
jgi:surface antigen